MLLIYAKVMEASIGFAQFDNKHAQDRTQENAHSQDW